MTDLFGRSDNLILEKVTHLYDSLNSGDVDRSLFTMTVAAGTSWQLIYTFPVLERITIKNLFVDFRNIFLDPSGPDIDYKISMMNNSSELEIGSTEGDNTLLSSSILYVVDVLNYNSLDPSGEIKVYSKVLSPLSSDRSIEIINLYEVLGGAL